MSVRDFIQKLHSLSDQQKKAIIIAVVCVLSFFFGFWWVRTTVDRVGKAGQAVKDIKLPQIDAQVPELPKIDVTKGWKVYTNSKYGFQVKYPDTIDYIDNSDFQTAFFYKDAKQVLMGSYVGKSSEIKIDPKQIIGQENINGVSAERVQIGTTSQDDCQALIINKGDMSYTLESCNIVNRDLFNKIALTFKFTK